MNNNRNNNRRRGRGNRQQGSGGGGGQINRIDSRARGNAPQMLDKYKKLAQDAQHHGDRVQAEYYLQFADHYFRVIADNKSRQDEQRGKRGDDREAGNDDGEDDYDFDDRRPVSRSANRNERAHTPRNDADDRDTSGEGDDEGQGSEYEPSDNPFTRNGQSRGNEGRGSEGRNETRGNEGHRNDPHRTDERGDDGRKGESRRGRGRRSAPDGNGDGNGNRDSGGEIDSAVLPPSISDSGEGEKPKRKPAARRRKAGDDDDGGALKAVG